MRTATVDGEGNRRARCEKTLMGDCRRITVRTKISLMTHPDYDPHGRQEGGGP